MKIHLNLMFERILTFLECSHRIGVVDKRPGQFNQLVTANPKL